MNKITLFKEEFGWLGNYYKHPITYKGKLYGSTEAAYQAHKSLDEDIHELFTTMGPGTSKKEGQLIEKRLDWETYKEVVMYEVLVLKFEDRVLRKKLIETHPMELIEGNWWHDNTWGDCTCVNCVNIEGRNLLGKTLMRVREEVLNDEFIKAHM